MLNWCENHLTISGEEEAVKDFAARARSTTFDEKDDAEAEELPLCLHALYPVPDAVQSQPYDPIQYNWLTKHWGVKWDIIQENFDEVRIAPEQAMYAFLTPWAPPLPWLEKVAADYPSLEFRLVYREIGMNFQGRVGFKSGKLIDQWEESPITSNLSELPELPPEFFIDTATTGIEEAVSRRQ